MPPYLGGIVALVSLFSSSRLESAGCYLVNFPRRFLLKPSALPKRFSPDWAIKGLLAAGSYKMKKARAN